MLAAVAALVLASRRDEKQNALVEVAVPPDAGARRPIRLVVTDDTLDRSRLTVFFRLLLALPILVWAALWGLAALAAAFVLWLAVVVNRKAPGNVHDFVAGYVRYATHVGAYLMLAANPYPWFKGSDGYPVDVEIDGPAEQSRASGVFRLFLALPALILAAVLGGGIAYNGGSFATASEEYVYYSAYTLGGAASAAAFLTWFYALVRGRAPRGLRDLIAFALGYSAQTTGYFLLLTGRYPTSDPALAESWSDLPGHPVRISVTDDVRRSRLTVLFRLLLTVPHFVWITLWAIVAVVAILVAWVVGVVTGRVPAPIHRFLCSFVRYLVHVYAFLHLIGNRFPGFTGRAGSYEIDVELPEEPERQRRLSVLFRLFLAVPALIVASALYGVLLVIALLGWWYALATGRMPAGMRNLGASCLRYGAQTNAYLFLLTARYPSAAPVLRSRPQAPARATPLPRLLLPGDGL